MLWLLLSGPQDYLLSLIPNEIDLITIVGGVALKLDRGDGVLCPDGLTRLTCPDGAGHCHVFSMLLAIRVLLIDFVQRESRLSANRFLL